MTSIYFDGTEPTNAKWKSLMQKALLKAKKFKIHCWTEETDEIKLALEFGVYKETTWDHGKVICGDVTDDFCTFVLEYPKPTDTEIYNKMTPFFNIFLDDDFQSCHWGTEVHWQS